MHFVAEYSKLDTEQTAGPSLEKRAQAHCQLVGETAPFVQEHHGYGVKTVQYRGTSRPWTPHRGSSSQIVQKQEHICFFSLCSAKHIALRPLARSQGSLHSCSLFQGYSPRQSTMLLICGPTSQMPRDGVHAHTVVCIWPKICFDT